MMITGRGVAQGRAVMKTDTFYNDPYRGFVSNEIHQDKYGRQFHTTPDKDQLAKLNRAVDHNSDRYAAAEAGDSRAMMDLRYGPGSAW
jgi:hypothetical protein